MPSTFMWFYFRVDSALTDHADDPLDVRNSEFFEVRSALMQPEQTVGSVSLAMTATGFQFIEGY